jgi:hypothetical protein
MKKNENTNKTITKTYVEIVNLLNINISPKTTL